MFMLHTCVYMAVIFKDTWVESRDLRAPMCNKKYYESYISMPFSCIDFIVCYIKYAIK